MNIKKARLECRHVNPPIEVGNLYANQYGDPHIMALTSDGYRLIGLATGLPWSNTDVPYGKSSDVFWRDINAEFTLEHINAD